MKVAIGTANFQNNYGLLKSFVKINKLKKISNEILKHKIDFLDTSFDYKNLELKIFKKLNKFKLITKIKLPKRKKNEFIKDLEDKIKIELKRLKKKNFEVLLFHNTDDLKYKIGDDFLNEIKKLKKKKLIKNIGISIYDPKELKIVFSKFIPDIIQAPLNVFDARILMSRYLRNRKKKIKLQVRSVFLQGLLLQDLKKLKKLNIKKNLRSKLIEFDNICKKNKISKLEQSINFIKLQDKVDIITFGINSSENLRKNMEILEKKKVNKIIDLTTNDKNVIDPRKW